MCGRFYIAKDDPAQDMIWIKDRVKQRTGEAKTEGEVFPTDVVPVIANTLAMQIDVFAMRWGYTAANGRVLFNARSETAAQKTLFCDGMAQRRCIIAATCYFEWEKRGNERIKYAIAPEGSRMIYMAGIYRKEGNRAACTILTRAPAPEIAFIHDRMPVLLPATAVRDWLNVRCDAAAVLQAAIVNVEFRPA